MKFLVFLVVLTSLTFSARIAAQETTKLEVIKFNWGMYEPRKAINEPSLFDDESANLPNRNNRAMEKTIEEQSRDLRKIENAARKSAANPPGNIFLYELKVKNADGKAIKSFIWEYRFAPEIALRNDSRRHFLCVEKIKAGDNKTLRIISRLPPINVVDATAANDNSKKDFTVDVVINQVEFADGTIWKRTGWDDSRYRLDSPKIDEKLKAGDCLAL